jgi:hypothetical protein
MKKRNEVNIEDVREVEDFMKSYDRLQTYRDKHKKVFETYEELAHEYNERLELAHQMVKQKGISCGPFVETSCSYDGELLHNSVGRDGFMNLGGEIGTKTTFKISKRDVEKAVGMKELESEVAEAARRPRISKPHKVDMPS